MRPWTSPRHLLTGLQLGAVAALTLLAPVLMPSRAAFAYETSRSTVSTTTPPRAKPAVDLEGTLEILIEDREDGSRLQHFLSTQDGNRLLVEGVQQGQDLLTGDRVRVKGQRVEKTIVLEDSIGTSRSIMGLEMLAPAPLSNTLGPQKAVVLLVNFSNDLSQPYTIDDARRVFSDVTNLLTESSYGQMSLAVDVFGWYTISMQNTSCDSARIRSLAQMAATAHGVNLASYGRQIYAFPFNGACTFAGMGTIGGSPSSAWFNGNLFVSHVAHELGHNFGLYHSHALWCGGSTLGTSCAAMEYGDAFDPMGQGTGHYNAFQKERLGWLNYGISPPVTIVQASGIYTLDAYETVGTGPKALRITRGTTGQSFYVELRRSIAWDTSLSTTPGVLIHLATDSDPNASYLLDMTPGTTSFADAVLAVGETFTDASSGITITTLSESDTSATITVGMGVLPCARSRPSVTASPILPPAVQPGSTVMYTVAVTNTDSVGCSASSFALLATAPTGWSTSLGAVSLTLSPGATGSTTLQVSSLIIAAAGPYTIVAAATNGANPGSPGSASVTYAVAPVANVTPPGSFTDNFDRPDSPSLGNGWVAVTGSLQIQAWEARNQANATPNLTVQPGLVGAAQMVATSFASTNNNSAPRFGVVVRYQDPKNYYTCYRQVGGSSVVRIAKVKNGVEFVLKSVGIGNPVLNVFSTLFCQAIGSTLTLRVDGVTKLSTIDATFTTGSVGYSIWSRTAGSHRADNFSVQ